MALSGITTAMQTHWVPWWQRLQLALAATFVAWLCTSIVLDCLSPRRIIAELLSFGMFIAVDYFLLLATPLVLIWPVKSQLKHWYAFLCVGAVLSVLLTVPYMRHPLLIGREIRSNPEIAKGIIGHVWKETIPIVFGMTCYLLLLRRRQAHILRQMDSESASRLNEHATRLG
jgi:hypothetical protein